MGALTLASISVFDRLLLIHIYIMPIVAIATTIVGLLIVANSGSIAGVFAGTVGIFVRVYAADTVVQPLLAICEATVAARAADASSTAPATAACTLHFSQAHLPLDVRRTLAGTATLSSIRCFHGPGAQGRER